MLFSIALSYRNDRLLLSVGFWEFIGLLRVDEDALCADAEAGVTVMATDVLSVGLGALPLAGARGVASRSAFTGKPLGLSSMGDGGIEGRFIAGGDE